MQVYLSRQPIFDRSERIAGFALFHRQAENRATAEESPERLVVDAVLGIGLDNLTGRHPAYLAVTYDMLLRGALELLDRRRIIAEVPHDCAGDPDIVAACRRLHGMGYRLAIEGHGPVPEESPLLKWCDIVRIDVASTEPAALEDLARRLQPFGVALLAENVENRETRDVCLEVGFELFQGYAFSVPEVLVRKDVAIDHLRTFQLMRQLRDYDVTDSKIEEAFRTDLSLSYKLLRMVNSAAVGGRGIASIGHAIRLLGREMLYRWLALLLVTTIAESELDTEMVHTALLRARLCELLAPHLGLASSADSLYITGLFSIFDVLLGIPMHELVEEMGLSRDIRSALLDRTEPLGPVLALVEAYDLGRWDEVLARCHAMRLEPSLLASLYLSSLAWANERQLEQQ